LRRPRLADRQTNLFGGTGTEFIAPDILFKATKAEAPENTEVVR